MKKLNICIVQPNNRAYSETFIRNHVTSLPANILNTYGPWWPEFDDAGHSLKLAYLHRSFVSNAVRFASKLLPHKIFTHVPATVTGFPSRDESLLRRSFKYFLKKHKIDVVLAEYGIKGAIVKDLCAELDIPLVVHFHGYDAHLKELISEFAPRYKEMFRQAAAVIVVSKYMRQALLDLGAAPEKLHLVYYGVNTGLFKQANPADNDPVLVAVGRFVDTKAPVLTILAFDKALKKVPAARLVMIGQGPLLEICRAVAAALHITDRVEFTGVQTPAQVSAAMQHARAFVLHSMVPSHGDAEGTPNVVLEAMSTGLPVISTYHAGIPDVIKNGVTGLLCEEKDIDVMAENMVRLLSEPELAGRMGAAARKDAEQNFALNDQLGKLMDIIMKSVKK